MAISGSPPISFSTLSAEINVALPIAINHARLQALIGHNLPIAISEYLGRSGRIDGNFATSGSFPNCSLNSVGGSYYGATVSQIGEFNGPQEYILFNSLPNYLGDLIVRNNTTGVSRQMTLLSSTGPYEWSTTQALDSNWLRAGGNDNFTIMAA